jgi:hypothetical protein
VGWPGLVSATPSRRRTQAGNGDGASLLTHELTLLTPVPPPPPLPGPPVEQYPASIRIVDDTSVPNQFLWFNHINAAAASPNIAITPGFAQAIDNVFSVRDGVSAHHVCQWKMDGEIRVARLCLNVARAAPNRSLVSVCVAVVLGRGWRQVTFVEGTGHTANAQWDVTIDTSGAATIALTPTITYGGRVGRGREGREGTQGRGGGCLGRVRLAVAHGVLSRRGEAPPPFPQPASECFVIVTNQGRLLHASVVFCGGCLPCRCVTGSTRTAPTRAFATSRRACALVPERERT